MFICLFLAAIAEGGSEFSLALSCTSILPMFSTGFYVSIAVSASLAISISLKYKFNGVLLGDGCCGWMHSLRTRAINLVPCTNNYT